MTRDKIDERGSRLPVRDDRPELYSKGEQRTCSFIDLLFKRQSDGAMRENRVYSQLASKRKTLASNRKEQIPSHPGVFLRFRDFTDARLLRCTDEGASERVSKGVTNKVACRVFGIPVHARDFTSSMSLLLSPGKEKIASPEFFTGLARLRTHPDVFSRFLRRQN